MIVTSAIVNTHARPASRDVAFAMSANTPFGERDFLGDVTTMFGGVPPLRPGLLSFYHANMPHHDTLLPAPPLAVCALYDRAGGNSSRYSYNQLSPSVG
jgi:hypothetical protein